MHFSFYLLVLAGLTLVFLFWGTQIVRVVKMSRRAREENLKATEKTVDMILEQIGWENKQRWVSDSKIEFGSVLLGLEPYQHKAWARVCVSKKEIAVTLEYYYDTDVTEREWVNGIADCFKRRNIPVAVVCANRQPTPDEIYLPKSHDE